jgi:hypothetical protein
MQAIFIADGPFSIAAKRSRSRNHFDSNCSEPTVIEGFANVEMKGLIAKLLGVAIDGTSHNGTSGFWDKYF